MEYILNNYKNSYDNNYEPYYDDDYEADDIRSYKKKRRGRKRRRVLLWLITLGFLAILIDLIVLLYTGKIWFNSPARKDYPVRGITVSSLQGAINFNALEIENVSFAYIKSSEGKSLKDTQFDASWNNSKDSTVKTGAYHKFSFTDDGQSQAENFIRTVGKISKNGYRLIPAVEVTKSGLSLAYSPKKDTVVSELKAYCNAINDEYGVNPIIITGDKFYKDYLKDDFSEYSLWIIDLLSKPDSIHWSLWNYSPRGRIEGTSNSKNYINLSVFNGSKHNFSKIQF